MRKVAANDILDSVVEITGEHDCEHFRRSLSGTIREIAAVDEVLFARPQRTPAGSYNLKELYRESHSLRPDEAAAPPGMLDAQAMQELAAAGYRLSFEGGMSTLLLPVMERDTVAELLILRAPDLGQHALELLKGFTRLYRNFRSLIVESEHDPLTGLRNRRTLESRLGSVVREAHRRVERAHWPAGLRRGGETQDYLAVLDIDHFKRINDGFGHLFGDEVLVLLASLMRKSFRDEDLLFRFGGEEFVVILLAHSAEDARNALERFRSLVASHRFPQIERITMSIGMSRIRPGDVPSTVVGRADQALYYAKEQGRNQVREYEVLAESGALQQPVESQDVELF
jgi:diguanylate cyclase (GGDEF)-like protein